MRPDSAWHEAHGANVQLRLELMVHWLETLPGTDSYFIIFNFNFLVFSGTKPFHERDFATLSNDPVWGRPQS